MSKKLKGKSKKALRKFIYKGFEHASIVSVVSILPFMRTLGNSEP
jgi:hypothetical protein